MGRFTDEMTRLVGEIVDGTQRPEGFCQGPDPEYGSLDGQLPPGPQRHGPEDQSRTAGRRGSLEENGGRYAPCLCRGPGRGAAGLGRQISRRHGLSHI